MAIGYGDDLPVGGGLVSATRTERRGLNLRCEMMYDAGKAGHLI